MNPPAAAGLVVDDPDVAAELLRRGGLVAIPTETVYGLAADASRPDAVARIFEVKGRPRGHPLIVHLPSADRLADWAARVPRSARILAEACWPGPLTLLVERAAHVDDVVTGGRMTVGIRVPAHPLTARVLAQVPALAAPSANRFGKVSPTTADHVLADLGSILQPGRDAILDGGACPVGVESTIVDCTVEPPQILRPGGISTEDVSRLLRGRVAAASGPSRTSGMLASHYAPDRPVELVETAADLERRRADLVGAGRTVEVLDGVDDLVVYARELYAWLRAADRRAPDVILARLPPPDGLGHAIRDRLMKAAASPSDPSRAR